MRLADSILIDCPADQLYTLTSDIERHAEILPGYTESRVVERNEKTWLVQRDAVIHGKRLRWKSEVWFDAGRALHFRQAEGPFKGMRVDWVIEPRGRSARLEIIHTLRLRPRWKGWWIERRVAKPAIEYTARRVLEAIKAVAEKKVPAEVAV